MGYAPGSSRRSVRGNDETDQSMNEFGNDRTEDSSSAENLLNLNDVMQAFGVSAWKNLGPIETPNTNFLSLLVEINGQNYVLRERPDGPIGENIHFRYDFQQYLQQAGIPVPSFLRTPQGEPTVKLGEDFFEIQQQIGGEFFSTSNPRSLDWIAAAGTMLGRIHQASQHYTSAPHPWPAEAQIGSVVQGYLNLARSRANQAALQAISSALSEWTEQWEAVLPAAMMSIGAHHALPEFHIHGDYHALNVRFGPFGVSAVTGLEAARWEKRIFEVAYGLFYFSGLAWLPGSTVTPPLVKRGFEPERMRSFLHGYNELCPPVKGEAALLVDALMLISPIVTLNGPLEDLFYADEEAESAIIDDMLERLAWATSLPAWLGRVRRSFAEMWD
jgi:Ser/Thr protein kinase RdoA (MazF antagonist)